MSCTVCGLLGAVLRIEKVAVVAPRFLLVMVTAHRAPAASVVQPFMTLNLVLVTLAPLKVTATVPALVKFTVRDAEPLAGKLSVVALWVTLATGGGGGGGGGTTTVSNVAATDLAASMVTTQAVVPAQAPDQPANTEPEAGVAVSETTVPAAKGALQVAPQSSPAGAEATLPVPEPARVTSSA